MHSEFPGERPSLRSWLVCFGRLHPHFLFYKRVHSPGLADESATQPGTGRGLEPVRDHRTFGLATGKRSSSGVVKIVWLIQNGSGPWEKRLSKIRSASRAGGGWIQRMEISNLPNIYVYNIHNILYTYIFLCV